jgi:hypothetical protein
MAQIPRPPKQGNVMTYVAKVAAGYPHILAGEMDADLDTIYGAWNSGVDTVNIRDGAVTPAKLAADAVGPRELQDSGVGTSNLADVAVTTPKIADGAVTDPKIVSIAWPKVTGAPAAFPPSGTAGGDLQGSYPTPQIRDGAVTAAKLGPGAVGGPALGNNSVGAAQIVDGSVGTAELGDLQVTRAKLAVNASNSTLVFVPNPTGFVLSTAGVWTTYATLPSLTTRGGAVLLFANPATSVTALANAGTCNTRWLRDGALVTMGPWLIVAPSPNATPMPGLNCIDTGASPGAHVYVYQVLAGANATIVSASLADGGFHAMEIG